MWIDILCSFIVFLVIVGMFILLGLKDGGKK